MVADWAGDMGEALGKPSEDFKPAALIELAKQVTSERNALLEERRTLLAENVRLREALESAAWLLADISPNGLVRKKVEAALSIPAIARATGATP